MGYISIKRIKRLVCDEVLKTLDYFFCTCMDCIKRKQTNKTNRGVTLGGNEVLRIIHTDIHGPFNASYLNG